MRIRAGALIALVAAFVFGAAVAAPNANAHASLRSSDPDGGTQIAAAPDQIAITFTEQPEPALSSVRVLGSTGEEFQSGKPTPAGGDPLTLRTAVGDLPQGVYTVLWRVVSRVDGHATAGAFAFGVGVSPEGAPVPPVTEQQSTPDRSSLEMLGRFLMFAGIVAMIGGAWFAVVVLRGDDPVRDRRLIGFVASAWTLSAIGVPLLAEAQRRAADTGFADLAATSLGRALVVRGVAILAAGAAIAVALHSSGRLRRVMLAGSGVAAAVAAFVHVQAGHASATTSPGPQVAAQIVHVLAVSLWVGGFGALLAAVRGTSAPEKTRAIKRYSTTAGVALLVVLATGVARSLGELETLGDLTGTGYGRAALVKIVVFGGLIALGAMNRYRNVRRAHQSLGPLRAVVRFEAGLGIVALVAAATMASLAPPSPESKAAATRPEQIVASGSDFATTIRARMTIAPGFAGVNTFDVTVNDYDSGRPITGADVSIRFAYLDDRSVPASITILEDKGRGRYTGQTANMSLDGRWRLTTLVQQGGSSVEVPLSVATRCRVIATPFEGQPTLYDAKLPDGLSAQMYAGDTVNATTEIHVTLFDASGTETFVRSVGVTASRGDSTPEKLPHRRFTDGHFIARGKLASGIWRFDITIATPEGTFKTCFEETIGG